jgi:hypothetical protein
MDRRAPWSAIPSLSLLFSGNNKADACQKCLDNGGPRRGVPELSPSGRKRKLEDFKAERKQNSTANQSKRKGERQQKVSPSFWSAVLSVYSPGAVQSLSAITCSALFRAICQHIESSLVVDSCVLELKSVDVACQIKKNMWLVSKGLFAELTHEQYEHAKQLATNVR